MRRRVDIKLDEGATMLATLILVALIVGPFTLIYSCKPQTAKEISNALDDTCATWQATKSDGGSDEAGH